jgi:hypothetical protein
VGPHATQSRDGFAIKVAVMVGILGELSSNLNNSIPIPSVAELIRVSQTALGNMSLLKKAGTV